MQASAKTWLMHTLHRCGEHGHGGVGRGILLKDRPAHRAGLRRHNRDRHRCSPSLAGWRGCVPSKTHHLHPLSPTYPPHTEARSILHSATSRRCVSLNNSLRDAAAYGLTLGGQETYFVVGLSGDATGTFSTKQTLDTGTVNPQP